MSGGGAAYSCLARVKGLLILSCGSEEMAQMYTFKIYDVCIAFNTPLALQKRSKGVASDARHVWR